MAPDRTQARARALDLSVRCMDLTSLEDSDTPEKIGALAARAVRPDPELASVPSAAAVCVYPRLVPAAREVVAGSGVRVAAATGGFPLGRASTEERVEEIAGALALGADEIDTVIDHEAVRAGRDEEARAQIAAAREACGAATMKVILETGALEDAATIRRAAMLAMDAGADFLKTSTGKAGEGATLAAAECMMAAARDFHRETGRAVGIKVAGGIRSAEQAIGYLMLLEEVLGEEWVTPERFRIGASSLLDDLLAEIRAAEPADS